MADLRSTLERGVGGATPPPDAFERMLRRGDRKRRNQRITAGVVGFAVFVAAIWVVTSVRFATGDGRQQPAAPGATAPVTPLPTTRPWVAPAATVAPWVTPPATSGVDFLIDVNTGETTPLSEAIIGPGRDLTGQAGRIDGRYAASPDASRLAFIGQGEQGTPQIFIANLDGSDVRQVTNQPTSAIMPAWSPDGGSIAYIGNSHADGGNLFVLDIATGASSQIGDEVGFGPSFTPDGSSLLYTASAPNYPLELRTVPIAGGQSAPLFGADANIVDSGDGSISPDGSLVTFLSSDDPLTGETAHCGPCRFMANIDGTNRQVIGGWMTNEAGTWSPDGSRIVAMDILGEFDMERPEMKLLGDTDTEVIVVVDVATEKATIVAYGGSAIWVDDHTLLVEV